MRRAGRCIRRHYVEVLHTIPVVTYYGWVCDVPRVLAYEDVRRRYTHFLWGAERDGANMVTYITIFSFGYSAGIGLGVRPRIVFIVESTVVLVRRTCVPKKTLASTENNTYHVRTVK